MINFLALIFLNLSAFAQSPQMPTEVFKASWKNLESLQESLSLCHDLASLKNLSQDGMNASISCLVKCSKSEERLHELKRNFIPNEQGMRKGDGNLWASLSTTIKYWSEETCFHFAAQECKGLTKVENVESQGVKSGEWTFAGKVSCGKSQGVIYSPFDFKIKKEPVLPVKETDSKDAKLLNLSSDWRRPFGMSHQSNKVPAKTECTKKVAATFCYGDCISISGELNREFLAGPEPLGSDQYEFCMDSLLEKVKKRPVPHSILVHLCETEILSELKKRSATGLTCASSRLETTCSDL
jgi:hypothetical protein